MAEGWRKSSRSYAGSCAEVAAWRVPSASNFNGNCAEVGTWRPSARCQTSECAEAGACGRGVAVRDSKDRDGPVLLFSPAAFTAALR